MINKEFSTNIYDYTNPYINTFNDMNDEMRSYQSSTYRYSKAPLSKAQAKSRKKAKASRKAKKKNR